MGTTWHDGSQYQSVPIDDSYPHPFYCFRTNSGDRQDTLAVENARRAKKMLDDGKLQGVFPYYFFWPGQANCDLHRKVLEDAGLWLHPGTASMVDVEDAGSKILGDQSAEVNDEVQRLRGWYGDPRRVFGYLNAVANSGLWRTRPDGLRFVTPNYTGKPGELTATVPAWMRTAMFAHQYTDKGSCPPFPGGVDLNYSALSVAEIKSILGLGGSPVGVVEDGAAQLGKGFANVRKTVDPKNLNYLPSSFRDEDGPWPNDLWAALVNEIVWDGFDLDTTLADVPDSVKRSLVGLVRTIGARQSRIEGKLDRLIAKVGA